jgi:hypothetical protein
MRKCNICHVEKPLDDFFKNKYRALGHEHACKVCKLKLTRAYYKSHILEQKKRKAIWYQKNKEHRRIKDLEWRNRNREYYKARTRKYYLSRKEDICV